MPQPGREDDASLKDAEAYLRDSGVSFDEQDDRIYEQARRSRSRRRGYISPPMVTPLPLPIGSPPQLKSPQHPSAEKSHADLLAAFQRQQQVVARLRMENEEHVRKEDRLSADLLAMTHRYLQAQAAADELEKRCKDAEHRAKSLALELEEEWAMSGTSESIQEDSLSSRIWHAERLHLQRKQNLDRGDTATVSAGTVDSSEYVAVDLSSLSIRPEIPPEEVLKSLRAINLQSLEVARACIASTNFRPGIRTMQIDNEMVVDLTDGIGCIMVQILRSRDHSKSKTTVESGLRALLSYHASKLIEDWPFHIQTKRRSQGSGEGDLSLSEKEEFSEVVEKVLKDIATILSLSGSPVQPSSLIRSHRDRIGSTLDALFKTAEQLASQIKGGRFDGPYPVEYSFLYARPGATFNKDLMQRHGAQQSMTLWKSTPKKPAQVLCTREVGLARLHRTPAVSSPVSSTSSRSGSSGHGSVAKEIDVLSKVVVVFESDLDK